MLTHTPRLYISLDTSVNTDIAAIRPLARLQRGGTSAAPRLAATWLGPPDDRCADHPAALRSRWRRTPCATARRRHSRRNLRRATPAS